MGSFIERHRSTLLTVLTVAGVAAMIWLDARRGQAPIGAAAPDQTLTTLGTAAKVRLADLRGQPAVLDFWATWCGPCRQSLPRLDALSRRYEGRARFFAVNAQDEAPSEQERTRAELGLELPILSDGQRTAGLLQVEALPTTVLLDRDGKVAETFVGVTSDEALARAIDKLL